MFDKLEDLLIRFEEILSELQEPDVANDQNRFRKLMKEQNDLTPIVEAYREYKTCKQAIADSLEMLEIESDEEMRELAKEELNDAKKRVEELEHELKILLLPKDPNDDKNVVVEIRAGAGGDEAALFAAEIYRMYLHYAESRRWKVELVECEEIGIGGMKNVTFMINGQGAYSVMKYESGVHRVQRVPETESGGRIHTSTITVAVMPELSLIHISFNDCTHLIGRNQSFQERGQKIRKYHEDCHCRNNRERHCRAHQQFFLFFLLLHRFFCKNLFFFLFIKTGGISQGFNSDHHRINKIKDTSDKRSRCQHFPFYNTVVFFFFYRDLSVRLSDSYCIFLVMLHHNAF